MNNRKLKKKRYFSKVEGDNKVPRLVVFRSVKFIYAQLIDDKNNKTLACASDINIKDKLTKTARSKVVGKMIAEKAKLLKLSRVKFDRGGYVYHGRVKELAESVRENGLKI